VQFEFLNTIVGLLDAAQIPHMLAGSMASSFHGEPRMTRDIDLVVDPTPETMQHFIESLDRSRFYIGDAIDAVERRDMCNVIDTHTGWKADLIVRRDRPFSRSEFDRRQRAEIGGIGVYVATAEDTVLAKLEWRAQTQSDQQMRDVVSIVSAQTLDLEYLRRWAVELEIAEVLEDAVAAATSTSEDR